MNDTRNRDRPASQLTKREEAALRVWALNRDVAAKEAVAWADQLFDVLDTPAELRDDFDHEGTP